MPSADLMTRKIYTISLLLFISIFVSSSSRLAAQAFGKNKVQYKNFDWMYIQTSHFDIYFSTGGKEIAEFTAVAAESALVKIHASLRYEITNRIPIIVYNSHNDFQQTNVISPYLEEGIGGVTELFKNRVVLPFEGSYRQFRHVIHHELVHAVLNDMFYGGSIQNIIANNIKLQLPLWLNEGLAEYLALEGWDTNSDMFIRDATVNNYLPPIIFLDGYFAYRGGQSLWWYVAEKYGKEKVGDIMNHIRASRNIDQGFRNGIGLTIEELSERWQKEQKVMYWPDIAKRKSPQDFAKRLSNHRKLGNFYNTSPAISPAGDKVAFISDRSGYFSVYVMSATDGSDVKEIIEGQQSADFEELHLLTPGITWSPDGKKIALSVKAGSSDAIFIIDVESGRKEKLPVELDGIFSVEWSSGGDRLAFVGNNSKQSDIYIYDLQKKETTNLTNDIFSDAQPAWSPDDKTVYFVSDRWDKTDLSSIPPDLKMIHHDFSQLDIYSIDVDTKIITRITRASRSDETYPIIADGGKKMLFISDRNGINNIYVREFSTRKEYPITNSISGVYQLSISRDGNKIAFASMDEAGFDIFSMKSPLDKPALDELEQTEFLRKRLLEESYASKLGVRRDTLFSIEKRNSDSASIYGEGIALNLSPSVNDDPERSTSVQPRIIFRDENKVKIGENVFAVKNNTDAEGNYKVNKYKLSFSPDLIYGNAGWSTFYGVLGTTQMLFSDLLGDHQIMFVASLLSDLKNSDFGLAYFYLPDRIDWGFQGYHTARFIYGSDNYLYGFRNFGFNVAANMPFDKFNRLDLALGFMNISRQNLDIPDGPIQETNIILPSISIVHDNSKWGFLAPVMGSRYDITMYGSPGLFSNSLTFTSVTFDYRKYWNFWTDFSYVIRFSGGGSFGANPQRFFIGGTENWINRTFENGYIPIEDASDFAFLTPGLPLRGFNYNARIATRYGLINTELRFPLVKYFFGGILQYLFQNINTVLFVDIGGAFDDPKYFKGITDDETGKTVAKDLLMGTGFGFRLFFLGFPMKFDIAWAYTVDKFSKPIFYFSLGGDF